MSKKHFEASVGAYGNHTSITKFLFSGVTLNMYFHLCVIADWLKALLTEVTLGLFLHSGDGTVLVCEKKLLELGHLVF